MIVPRWYQDGSIGAAMSHENSVEVAPTGSGKSVICAGIVNASEGGVLVLQPSLEILKSNLEKAFAFGMQAGVYSASAGKKVVGKTTYATIGSIINCLEKFKHVRTVIIDECHLVNPKGGMYEELISYLNPDRLVGLTATPYRLRSSSFGASMKIITRTRPKIFKRIGYVVNPYQLVEEGFLMQPAWEECDSDKSMLVTNTTGSEYTDRSKQKFTLANNLRQLAVKTVREMDSKHILVFAESVDDSQKMVQELQDQGITAAEINAKTKKKDRAQKLHEFETGRIRVMVNVGTLTTGYDFPALDGVVDASPTLSAALHYQKIGRIVRPFEKEPLVVDLAGNLERHGNPLTFAMLKIPGTEMHEVYSDRGRVTTRIMSDGPECETMVNVGKFKDSPTMLRDVDDGYIEWASREWSGEWKHIFYGEKVRRRIIAREKRNGYA